MRCSVKVGIRVLQWTTRASLLSGLLLCSISVSALADLPFLVKDINIAGEGSYPNELIVFNGETYFPAITGTSGEELWKTDGTDSGTVMVADIRPGSGSSRPIPLIVYSGELYFLADDGIHGRELWKTDGTTVGTELVKDIRPGTEYSWIEELTVVGGQLFFSADDGSNGWELWKTDGTTAGTLMVKDIWPGSTGGLRLGGELVDFAGKLLFSADDGVNGLELWTSDGTTAGTQLVKDINPGSGGSYINDMTYVLLDGNPFVIMAANDGTGGAELWMSQGTESSTSKLKEICPGSCGSSPALFTNFINNAIPSATTQALFVAEDPSSGRELWKTDGTPGGTRLIKNIDGLSTDSAIDDLKVLGVSTVFFSAVDANGRELWKSDGTTAGTMRLTDINPGSGSSMSTTSGLDAMAVVGSEIFFKATDGSNGWELWKYDGASASLVKDIWPGANGSEPERFAVQGSTLYLAATDPDLGRELMKSDGTGAGTVLVKDINTATASSSPGEFAALGTELAFKAEMPGTGVELWKSDGSALGTVPVKDIYPGEESSSPIHLSSMGNSVVFNAWDGVNGRELWRSDGTTAGTRMIKDINPSESSAPDTFVNLNGTLLFAADDGTTGNELWRSNGSAGGTILVMDIRLGTLDGLPTSTGRPVVLDNKMFFQADDGDNGGELWQTDGTLLGTGMVLDINPGAATGIPWYDADELAVYDGAVYFPADNGVEGTELWRTDGTPQGTFRVKDISTGSSSSDPNDLLVVGDMLFFTAYDEVDSNPQLWKTDGTEGGTVKITSGLNYPYGLFLAGGQLYFREDDGIIDEEIWRTDGSAAGTHRVADIWPGPTGSDPDFLGDLGGLVLFKAETPDHGMEPWVSDGTAAGTHMLQDIYTGAAESNPSYYGVAGGIHYFSASDGNTGKELWAIVPSCPGSLNLSGRRLIGDVDFESTGQIGGTDLQVSNGAIVSLTAGNGVVLGPDVRFAIGVNVSVNIDPAADCL